MTPVCITDDYIWRDPFLHGWSCKGGAVVEALTPPCECIINNCFLRRESLISISAVVVHASQEMGLEVGVVRVPVALLDIDEARTQSQTTRHDISLSQWLVGSNLPVFSIWFDSGINRSPALHSRQVGEALLVAWFLYSLPLLYMARSRFSLFLSSHGGLL